MIKGGGDRTRFPRHDSEDSGWTGQHDDWDGRAAPWATTGMDVYNVGHRRRHKSRMAGVSL